MTRTLLRRLMVPALALTLSAGCGIASSAAPASDFGATPGGVKDLNSARALVANGQVPPASALLVEAAFSEHDLPLSATPCSRTLCLQSAVGVAPDLGGNAAGWLQIGMSSNVNPATFRRPSTHMVFTVDVSGSMGWASAHSSNTDYGTPGRLAYVLASRIASQLTPGDIASLVTYGSSVSTVFEGFGGDDPAIQAALDKLTTAGSTNMEAGLRRAYEVAHNHKGAAEQTRIFLFSDEQPNVGATSATEFQKILSSGAADGIGITLFGLGLGHSNELIEQLSHLRGANSYSLSKVSDVDALMQDSWPWMASPIAYDLKLQVQPSAGFSLLNSFGFPGSTGTAALDVATVFLSRRKGALLLQLGNATGRLDGVGAATSLSYTTPSGQGVTDALDAAYGGQPLDSRGMYFPQPSVGKSVALAVLLSSMRKAAELYQTNRAEAVALMEKVVARITADAASLADPAFASDVKLAEDVLELMKKGAPQGDLYGR